MVLPDNCKEFFLAGITDVYIYPTKSSSIPVPFSVAQILNINNCVFPDALLHIATQDGKPVVAKTLTAKSTTSKMGCGSVFSLEISATITDGKENVRETQRKIAIEGDDYYIVLCREDGQLLLCYTLPNTFSFKADTSLSQSEEQMPLSISCKSMSDFISITIRKN